MSIQFEHNTEIITAHVIFNLRQVTDAIMIVPEYKTEELGQTILLAKRGGKWFTDCSLQQKFPATFSNLLLKLNLK
jgi:hypothetical protein